MKSRIKLLIYSITFSSTTFLYLDKYNFKIGIFILFLMIFFLYYIQSFFEVSIYFILNKKLNYTIVYPFIYDGKIRFAPVKLLYRNSLYINKLIGNLMHHIDRNLYSKTMELILIQYISKSLSVITTIFLFNSIGFLVAKEVILFSIGLILSDMIYEDISYNSLYITYKNREVIETLLSLFHIKENDYYIIKKFLLNYDVNKNYLHDILISLNRNAILYDVKLIDLSEHELLINKLENKTLIQRIKLMNIYYLIGFIGKKYNNKNYTAYSHRMIQKQIQEIEELEYSTSINIKRTKSILSSFLDFLEDKGQINQINKYIYYYNDAIFQKEYKFNYELDKLYKKTLVEN